MHDLPSPTSARLNRRVPKRRAEELGTGMTGSPSAESFRPVAPRLLPSDVASYRPGIACNASPCIGTLGHRPSLATPPRNLERAPIDYRMTTGFLPDCRLSLPQFSAFSRNRRSGFAKPPEACRIGFSDRIYAAF
jgi:hypothetical protein